MVCYGLSEEELRTVLSALEYAATEKIPQLKSKGSRLLNESCRRLYKETKEQEKPAVKRRGMSRAEVSMLIMYEDVNTVETALHFYALNGGDKDAVKDVAEIYKFISEEFKDSYR